MNQSFFENNLEIQLTDVYFVEDYFDARKFPTLRKYVYKIRYGDIKDNPITQNYNWNINPLTKTNKHKVRNLDISKLMV